MSVYAVIAGGGTAGHVHPALAIAEELVARGRERDEIHFIGSRRGLEADLVPAEGWSLTALPGRGIKRTMSLDNVSSGIALGAASLQALATVRRLRPQVLISVGGYASAPAAVAARILGVPVVVMEQNAVAGAANRLAAKWAKACAVSFVDTDLPNAVHTGNPSRPEIVAVDRSAGRAAARERLGVTTRHLVVAFGGSLGARRINTAVRDALPLLGERKDLTIRHVIGDRDWSDFGTGEPTSTPVYQRIQYENAMADVYAAADFVLCRAGATSVAEIALTGTPAVFVPLPGAPGDHQTLNARALADRDGGIIIADDVLTGARVAALIDSLLGDPGRLAAMGKAARTQGHADAASKIADLIEEHARVR